MLGPDYGSFNDHARREQAHDILVGPREPCAICRDDYPPDDLKDFGDDRVCSDCVYEAVATFIENRKP